MAENTQLKVSTLRDFNGVMTSESTRNYLKSVLNERSGAFVNNMIALVSNNANLQKCEPYSLMFAGIKATALDLPLDQNLGFAYVIPYENKKQGKVEAQFQLG